jgi:hypothetical protein
MTGLAEAAREIRETGTFGYVDRALLTAQVAPFMRD